MAYTPTNWQNDVTPLDETNMNHIELGVKAAHDTIASLTTTVNEHIANDTPGTGGTPIGDTISADNVIDTVSKVMMTPSERAHLGSLQGTVSSTGVLWNAWDYNIKPGNSASVNTTNIQNLLNNPSCPGIYFAKGVYAVNAIILPAGKALVGSAQSSNESISTCLKAYSCNTAVITARDAYGAKIRNLYIHGAVEPCHGISVETSNPPSAWYNFGLEIAHVSIYHCGKSGLYLPGVTGTTGMNWVFHFYDMIISECREYGVENHATDSTFEGMYLSGNYKGGLYAAGGNCMYSDIKIDYAGRSGWTGDMLKEAGGTGVIINCARSSFSNIDSQFSGHVGVKIYDSRKILFTGSIDTTGSKAYNAAGGTDIAVINSTDVKIIANVDNINGNYYAQKQVNIASNCTNVYAEVLGATRVTNSSPTSKVITNPASGGATTTVQVLTQSEYDALVQSDQSITSNGVVYMIK
jgi:hypothetical protein